MSRGRLGRKHSSHAVLCAGPSRAATATYPSGRANPHAKIIKALFALGGMVMYAGSFISWGFDYNLASIPISIALLGNMLIAGGSLLLGQVFRINAYASSIVTVESEQPVISTGLYALVRHPCIAQVSCS